MQALVSIVVPLYNTEKYISSTVQSIIAQSYSNWELIIINDGSTDNGADIIEPYLNDDRIKILSKTNTGVSDTRNIGANISTGEYLCFLDADDLFFEDNIKQKVNFLIHNPKFSIVHADVEIIDENDLSTGEYNKGRGGDLLDNLLLWEGTNIPGPSSIMIKRDVFFNIGKWDTLFSTAADQDFFFRIASKYKIGYINKVLTAYRVLPNSMSRNIAVMEKDHIGVYVKAEKNGLFKSFWFKKKCFSNLYLILAGSWWVNGKNKSRGLYFLLKAVYANPTVILKLLKKLIR